MGLFSNIFSLSGAKELNQAANAVVHVRMLLDEYERGNDFDFLCAAAWIAQVGFLDVVERNNWPMHYSLVAIINGHPTRMTIAEAMLQTSTRIMTKAQHLTSKELKFIEEIFDKGEAFYKIEQNMPRKIVDLFKK